MEDAHVVLDLAEHVLVQDIDILHALILHQVGEALLLHARHVENVGVADDVLVKLLVLLILDAVLPAVELGDSSGMASSLGDMKWKVGLKWRIAMRREWTVRP